MGFGSPFGFPSKPTKSDGAYIEATPSGCGSKIGTQNGTLTKTCGPLVV